MRENSDPTVVRDVFIGRNKPSSKVELRGEDLEDSGE